MDDEGYLNLVRDRAKKATAFVDAGGKEAYQQLSILNRTRLLLLSASAITGVILGCAIGMAGRRG